MSLNKTDIAELDKYFPPAGPCAFCGHKDKRHRLWDVIMGMHKNNEGIKAISHNYELPIEAVEAVISVQPYRREE